MKIKTNIKILNLEDKPLKSNDKDFTIGEAIASILIESKQGGKMKMYVLAQNFFKEKEVDIDSVDLILITKEVESTQIYPNLVTGQILLFLSKLK